MGAWALSNFREALAGVFSSRGVDNSRLDRWTNQAKREVESALQFEALKVCMYVDTVADQREYALPDGLVSIVSAIDTTTEKNLIRSDSENIAMRVSGSASKPVFWARRGLNIVFDPTPDGVYRIEVTLIKDPAELTAPADTTLLPSYWDNAIYFLAAHYGWMELGEKEDADVWMQRYTNYMRSRMRDEDWEGTSHSEPVRVVSNRSELRNR